MPVDAVLQLTDASELLTRQVHPAHVQEDRLWSRAFTPTNADAGLLSADRESLLSAKDAYERYLARKGLAEAGGTWGVTVGEFQEVGLSSYADPLPDNAAHALVDFASAGEDRQKGLAKLIYAKASARGRLHP